MTDYTRRTHIVRIPDNTNVKPGDPPSSSYIDIEVLDAIAFRGEGGKEMVLNMDNAKAVPYIVDDTGGGHAKQPGKPTRLSHMQRITSKTDPTQQLDIEVIDVVAFTASNGEEWILDMKATTGSGPDVFNTTDGTGTIEATRRIHDEKISPTYAEKNPAHYVKVQRCDAMAFRTIMGKEMVIKCPSNDDPNSSDPRASTYIWSPIGYDPSKENGPTPPTNKDANVYAAFVKNAGGILTDNVELVQGPLWWIRKISTGGAYIVVQVTATNKSNSIPPTYPTVTLTIDPKSGVKLLDQTLDQRNTSIPGQTLPGTIYFVWNNIAPLPTLATYNNQILIDPLGNSVAYSQQFSRFVHIVFQASLPKPNRDVVPPMTEAYSGSGWFGSQEDAQQYADAFNSIYAGPPQQNFTSYLTATGQEIDITGDLSSAGSPAVVYVAQLDIPVTTKPSYAFVSTYTFLLSIPTVEAFEEFTPNVTWSTDPDNGGTSTIIVLGYSDVTKSLKTLADLQEANTGYGGGLVFTQPDDIDPNYPNSANLADAGTFKVTTKVVAGPNPTVKAHMVQINVTGGDSDGPPPSG